MTATVMELHIRNDDIEGLEDVHLISRIAELNDGNTPHSDPADVFLLGLQDAIVQAAPPSLSALTVAEILDDIMTACGSWQKSTKTPPSLEAFPSHGNDSEDALWSGFVSDLEELGVPRTSMVKYSGQLCSPAQIQFHYPPERQSNELISSVDQKGPCLRLYIAKLGLDHDEANSFVYVETLFWTRSKQLTHTCTGLGQRHSMCKPAPPIVKTALTDTHTITAGDQRLWRRTATSCAVSAQFLGAGSVSP